ncbi:MAG TPA: cell division protein [Caulobacteraceae bacterium]|nr:cell division protein [Caulobacteraceae bacterium]
MNVFGVFDHRYRGFRVVEIAGLCVLLALALVVYLAKTHAGGERADITRIQAQIADEHVRIALLRAEVAELERPERLGALAHYLGLQPIAAAQEIGPDELANVAHAAPAKTSPPSDAAPTDSAAPLHAPATVAAAPKAAPPHAATTTPATDAAASIDQLADAAIAQAPRAPQR